MISKKIFNIEDIDLIVLDFDGVLTDNNVYTNNSGEEFVKCSRADGLGFDALKRINMKTLIMSTEKDKVVSARAKKLGVEVFQNVVDKKKSLINYANNNNISLKRILYIGNDVNDVAVMKICGYTACPSDSHDVILNLANYTLSSRGGEGVIRELIEHAFQINIFELLYN